MVKFGGKIVQIGFGGVGKSFFEKVNKEIKLDMNNYYVITRDKDEYENYMYLNGVSTNLCADEITKDNFKEVLSRFLGPGDLLLDFSDSINTKEVCKWCMDNKIMYLNTGEAEWSGVWYNILEETLKKKQLKEEFFYQNERIPIVLHHGNNPGLVSHFAKAAIEYIVKTQFKKNKTLISLLKENRFKEIARELGIRIIHVNDIDNQKIKEEYTQNKLVNTWSGESFFLELMGEASQSIGTHECVDNKEMYNKIDLKNGYVEYNSLAAETLCKTICPIGKFEGYLVPHEETITIADSLTIKEGENIVYRPSVMFVYSPCELAKKYLEGSKLSERDVNKIDEDLVVSGHMYPLDMEVVCKNKIDEGTEYVGVLLIGDKFEPVWVGNRVELSYLYKDIKSSYWQTPTVTPVAMSALSAVCWMIKHKKDGGIYFPDDIKEYKEIIKMAEKYISKTIYKTFSKEYVTSLIGIEIDNIQSKDFFVK